MHLEKMQMQLIIDEVMLSIVPVQNGYEEQLGQAF